MTSVSLPTLLWGGPVLEATGYADEVRGLATAAQVAGVPVALRNLLPEVPGVREALEARERRAVEQLLAAPVTEPFVELRHAPLESLGSFSSRAGYRIARSMFETDSLPSSWVAVANGCDELWVPSTFNRETFRQAGVRVPITVIPGGVNTQLFTPEVAPMVIPGVRGTVFLSVFEWRDRKGWDVLLRGWAEAFGPDDDVTLVLRTYPVGVHQRVAGMAGILAQIDQCLRDQCGGRSRRDVAPIHLVEERIPWAQLPAFYRSATAFVLPTRGEGWGRPFMEAMACGVPVIATRWSAHLDFLRDATGYLVETDGVVPAETQDAAVYVGQRWASPRVAHLVTQLRRVHADRREAAAIGARARSDMVAQWGWERAGDAIAQRMRALVGSGVVRGVGGTRVSVGAQPAGAVPSLLVEGGASGADLWRSEAAQWVMALSHPAVSAPNGGTLSVSWRVDHEVIRPSFGSDEERAWRCMGALAGRPGIQLTVLSPAEAHRAPVPPDGDTPWVVALAGAADHGLPGSWVAPLRDRASGVLVAHEGERQACLAAGLSAAQLTVVPLAVDPSRWARTGAAYLRAAPTAGTAVLLPATPWSLPRVQQLVALYQRLFVDTDPLVLHLRVPPVSPEAADPAHPAVAAYVAWRERLVAMRGQNRPKMPFIWLDDAAIHADEWPALYRSAHALLSPGTGCGTELLAAQRCGVPVLAVDGGAARQWLSAESGWVIPVDAEGRPQGDALRRALMAACDPGQRAQRVEAADAAWARHAAADAGLPGVLSAAWGERVAALWRASRAFTP